MSGWDLEENGKKKKKAKHHIMDWGDIIHVLMKFSKNSVRAAAGLRQEALERKRYEQ